MARKRQMVMEGRIMGIRTCQNTPQAVAPSTRAASTSSPGTLVNPATWQLQCEQAGSLGVTLRATEKSYWIIPVGTLLYLR